MRLHWNEKGVSGTAIAIGVGAVALLGVVAAVVALAVGGDSGPGLNTPRQGTLETLPPGTLETLPPGTLETLPPGTLETLPASTTTAAPPPPEPPPTPKDAKDALGPLFGDDGVDGAFQGLLPWPNVTTFDVPQLEGPGLTFVRSGLFDLTADQPTSDRWDDVDIPHVLGEDYVLFVGILDAPPQRDDGIDRQLGLIVTEGNENDAPAGQGAGHLPSSGAYFTSLFNDPDFGNGWGPMTGFDTTGGFNGIDTGAFGFFEFDNTTTAVLVPANEVGDSILSGLIFGRLTEGGAATAGQPATTRTVTLLRDPFGGRLPPLPRPGRQGDCSPDASTGCLLGRFAVTGQIEGADAEVNPGEDDDTAELTLEELLARIRLINGCGFNNHFWVFAAATTDVEYTITVTDTVTDTSRSYGNPLGQPAPAILDTQAFATCP